MFTIDVEKTEDVAVVRCAGRIVRGESIRTLKNAVISERNTRIVVLDLSEVQLVDAGGLAALVSLHDCMNERGIQLKLVNPTHFVREVLERTGLDRVFEISSLREVLSVLASEPAPAWRHAFCW